MRASPPATCSCSRGARWSSCACATWWRGCARPSPRRTPFRAGPARACRCPPSWRRPCATHSRPRAPATSTHPSCRPSAAARAAGGTFGDSAPRRTAHGAVRDARRASTCSSIRSRDGWCTRGWRRCSPIASRSSRPSPSPSPATTTGSSCSRRSWLRSRRRWRPACSRPNHLLHDITQSLNAAELARRQFREIARVAGLIFGGYPGQQKSMKQVQASSGLLFDVFTRFDPDNLLLHQAQREVLERQLEASRIGRVLARLHVSAVRLIDVERPTPLAFPLLVDRTRGEAEHREAGRSRAAHDGAGGEAARGPVAPPCCGAAATVTDGAATHGASRSREPLALTLAGEPVVLHPERALELPAAAHAGDRRRALGQGHRAARAGRARAAGWHLGRPAAPRHAARRSPVRRSCSCSATSPTRGTAGRRARWNPCSPGAHVVARSRSRSCAATTTRTPAIRRRRSTSRWWTRRIALGPFACAHEPPATARPSASEHRSRSAATCTPTCASPAAAAIALRLPCFVHAGRTFILPAFSALHRWRRVEPAPGRDLAFAIA